MHYGRKLKVFSFEKILYDANFERLKNRCGDCACTGAIRGSFQAYQ